MEISLSEFLLIAAIFIILLGPGLYRLRQRILRWQAGNRRLARKAAEKAARKAARAGNELLDRFSLSAYLIAGLFLAALVYRLLFADLGLPLRRYKAPDLAVPEQQRTLQLVQLAQAADPITALCHWDGWVYYAAGNTVCRIRPDGTGSRTLFTAKDTVTALTPDGTGGLYYLDSGYTGTAALYHAGFDEWGTELAPVLTTQDKSLILTALCIKPNGTLYAAAESFSVTGLTPAQYRAVGLASHAAAGTLYRVEDGGLTPLLTGLYWVDGLCADADGSLYLTQSPTGQLLQYNTGHCTEADQFNGLAGGLCLLNGTPVMTLTAPRDGVDRFAALTLPRHFALSLPGKLRQNLLGLTDTDARLLVCAPTPTLLTCPGLGSAGALCSSGDRLFFAAGNLLYCLETSPAL